VSDLTLICLHCQCNAMSLGGGRGCVTKSVVVVDPEISSPVLKWTAGFLYLTVY
jgi:hypothetical protein